MKKLATVLMFALGFFSAAQAQETPRAATAIDGIYQQIDNSAVYWVVSTPSTGASAVIAIPLSNLTIFNKSLGIGLPNGQIFRPTSLDFGDLFGGQIVGNQANTSGMWAFRGCNMSLLLTFLSNSRFTAQTTAISPTADGVSQGLNCDSLAAAFGASVGSVRTFTKAF